MSQIIDELKIEIHNLKQKISRLQEENLALRSKLGITDKEIKNIKKEIEKLKKK